MGAIGEAEFKGAEEEKEGKQVDGVDGELIGVFEPDEEHSPNLRVDFLQQKGKASLRDATAAFVPAHHKRADGEELAHGGGGVLPAEQGRVTRAVHDIVQDAFPLGGSIFVQKLDCDIGRLVVGGNAKGTMLAAAGQGEAE